MARYDSAEGGEGYSANYDYEPSLVNPPVILLAPKERTTSSGELWIGVSCSDAEYGGCVIHASNDPAHENYYPIGTIHGQSYHGKLISNLASATGLDTTHTLSVDLSLSGMTLESAGQQTADRLDSLCYVGGELLAFRDATPTGAHSYNLQYLHRGCFSSSTGASMGDDFVLLAGPLFKYRFNKVAVGGSLYFKFQAFNIYGGGIQDLANCQTYAITLTSDGGIKAL